MPPARTRRPPSRPRRSSGWRSGWACTCSRRRLGAPRPGLDARPILARTLALIGCFSLPAILIFAVASEPLLATAFGDDLTEAAGALPWLGLAMALLACSYLSVQYLLALGRASFVWVLAVALAIEVAAVAMIGADLEEVALALLAVQLVCALTVVGLAFRRRA